LRIWEANLPEPGEVTEKRVCVITGASGTVGSAFIHRYKSHFQIAAGHWRHPLDCATQNQAFIDPLEPHKPLPENDHLVFAIQTALASEAGVESACSQIIDRFHHVDLLINAATHHRPSALLDPSGIADAELFIQVNVLAPIRLAVAFAKKFWRSHIEENIRVSRNVINVSSTAGVSVNPDPGEALFSTSQAALNHATYHLASELWDIGVRVNAVVPDTLSNPAAVNKLLDRIIALDSSQDTGQLVFVP
jgi:NAD(P)-dependent dehydrogenase (short-subunit alcohol dehydrogenase family)